MQAQPRGGPPGPRPAPGLTGLPILAPRPARFLLGQLLLPPLRLGRLLLPVLVVLRGTDTEPVTPALGGRPA